jgi:hypothetical protein
VSLGMPNTEYMIAQWGNALAEAQFGNARHGQTKVMLASFPAA